MRRSFCLGIVPAVVVVAACAHIGQPAESVIRVLDYNIHAGKDASAGDNLERVSQLIAANRIDVALLQEVDRGTQRSGGVDQPAVLRTRTGFHSAFGKTLDYQGGQYGIAILSRWPVTFDTLYHLPVQPPQLRSGASYEPRGALHAVVSSPYGPIHFLNTHMDASGDDGYRRQEIPTVMAIADSLRRGGAVVMIGGDLNANPDSHILALVAQHGWRDAWKECGTGPENTYPYNAPIKRIDYLLLKESRCIRAEVLSSTASDHLPVLFEIALPRRSPMPMPAPAWHALIGPGRAGASVTLSASETRWVDSTLASLSPRQRIAQLMMPWVSGEYAAEGSPELEQLRRWVEDEEVGGLVMSIGTPLAYAVKLNGMQRRARVPLLIASDMENGPGMRLGNVYAIPSLIPQGGGTVFPPVMALGATRDTSLAFELGRVLGLEARAVGVHLAFGPVLDVNSNPLNPVINTRSFAEDPALVSSLARAYIRGARSVGLMTTGKHFPGHGDTRADSHIELPTIPADRARLDAIELPPFRAATVEGIDAIMTAHIAVTGVEGSDAAPATLSRVFMTDVLRRDIGFGGLLVTDAMTMAAVARRYGATEPLILAVEAGADVLLMPRDIHQAIETIASAVASGRLAQDRIDRSARRILEMKAKAGLNAGRLVSIDSIPKIVNIPPHAALARRIAERSVVLVRDSAGAVPLRRGSRVLSVTYADASDLLASRTFDRVLQAGGQSVTTRRADDRTTSDEYRSLRAEAEASEIILISAYVSPGESSGTVAAAEGFSAFVRDLASVSRPMIVVSFGSPYLLSAFPAVRTYMIAWGGSVPSQTAAASALLGGSAIGGKLPVSLPPHHRFGEGLMRSAPAGGN